MKQNPQKTSVSDCKQRTLDYLSRLINNRYKMKINETKRGVIYHYLSLFITLIINNKYIYINNLHGYLSDSILHCLNFMVFDEKRAFCFIPNCCRLKSRKTAFQIVLKRKHARHRTCRVLQRKIIALTGFIDDITKC
jgi:hypothetical protein